MMDGAAEVTEKANPQSAPISAALPQSSPQLSDARWGLVRYASYDKPLTHASILTRGDASHTSLLTRSLSSLQACVYIGSSSRSYSMSFCTGG